MTAPEWVETALDGDLPEGEAIVEVEELDEGKLAVVSTNDRGFVVRNRLVRSPEVHGFELTVPGSGRGRGGTQTSTEPLPEAAREAPGPGETEEPAEPEPDEDAPPLSEISGIGPQREEQLAEEGIHTPQQLLSVDAEDLADELGVSVETAQGWQEQVDLAGVHGIGPKRADSLREAGVHTLFDLASADPDELAEALDVSVGRVTGWQEDAVGVAAPRLLEVRGVGPARAAELLQAGVDTPTALKRADAASLAEQLDVSEKRVASWQDAAGQA